MTNVDRKIREQLDRAQASAPTPGPTVRNATAMELAMEAAREYARPETDTARQAQLLDSIRGLIGGHRGQAVPRPVAEAMGLAASEVNNWPTNL